MKIVYNITTKIEDEVARKWYRWMMDEHIPAMMETGCFESYRFFQLTSLPEEEGHTFTTQFVAVQRKNLQNYLDNHLYALQAKMDTEFKNQYVSFQTVMNLLDEGETA